MARFTLTAARVLVTLLFFVSLLLSSGSVYAQCSECVVTFLTISNSARANGMGSVSINLIDGQSAHQNPGALGLYHTDQLVSFSPSNKTDWLPTLYGDYTLESYSGGFGIPLSRLLHSDRSLGLGIGVAYSRLSIDRGTQIRTDEFNNVIGVFRIWEQADLYSVGVGIQRNARVGFGITYKKIESHLGDFGAGAESGSGSAEGTVVDIGVLAEYPLRNLMAQPLYLGSSERFPVNLELTPSVAFVYSNLGNDISYIDANQADPIPTTARIGLSVYGAATCRDAGLLSARFTWQQDRSQKGSRNTADMYGFEIGLADVFYLRRGRSQDIRNEIDIDTRGYGFSLGGLLSWVDLISGSGIHSPVLRYVIDHADITYDHAEYQGDQSQVWTDTEFTSWSFTL